MVTVCVIGGGTAGVEAAAETARCGAEVTLLEASDHFPAPRSLWPRLLDGEGNDSRRRHILNALKVRVLFGVRARSLGPDGRIQGQSSTAKFDRTIITTGSRSESVLFPGSKKSGVHILRGETDYLELAAERASTERVVVSGSGMAAFEVAERLNRHGKAVTVLGRASTPAGLCRELGELVESRATGVGIRISRTRLQKAAGSTSLEAVVAGGKIIPCDSLAVVPSFCPECPPGSPQSGPCGGVSVNESMRSSEASVFAAGSCAEMVSGEGPVSVPLGASSSASGRVAGANAAGLKVALEVAGTFTAEIFGLRLEGAGLTFDQARRCGQEVVETVWADGASSVCSLVHDRVTGRLVGGQVADESCEGLSRLIASAVSRRLDVGNLAYADLGSSTDISVLQDTARQGMAWR